MILKNLATKIIQTHLIHTVASFFKRVLDSILAFRGNRFSAPDGIRGSSNDPVGPMALVLSVKYHLVLFWIPSNS